MGSLLYLSYILFVIRLPGVMARWLNQARRRLVVEPQRPPLLNIIL
nr:MAG TPA: hypothetical protein [Caudoviricetes sp.]